MESEELHSHGYELLLKTLLKYLADCPPSNGKRTVRRKFQCRALWLESLQDWGQEVHGPHRSPEKQFKSINTFAQSFNDAITLIKREKALYPF